MVIFLPIALLPVIFLGAMALFLDRVLTLQRPLAPLVGAAVLGAIIVLVVLTVWLAAVRLTRPVGEAVSAMARFLSGEWRARLAVHGEDEIGDLRKVFNRLADSQVGMYGLLAQDGDELSADQWQLFSRFTQAAAESGTLDELLEKTLDLVIEHFNCQYAAFYAVENGEAGKPAYAALRRARGNSNGSHELGNSTLERRFKYKNVRIDSTTTSDWLVGKSIALGCPQVGLAETGEDLYEAAIPISRGPWCGGFKYAEPKFAEPWVEGGCPIGVLDLFSAGGDTAGQLGPFSMLRIAELQTLANMLAGVIHDFDSGGRAYTPVQNEDILPSPERQALEAGYAASVTPNPAYTLYRTGQRIVETDTRQAVLEALSAGMAGTPYWAAILTADGERLKIFHQHLPPTPYLKPENTDPFPPQPPLETDKPSVSASAVAALVPSQGDNQPGDPGVRPVVVPNLASSELPGELLGPPRRMGCDSAAFLPVSRNGQTASLLILGRISADDPELNLAMLAPYINLMELLTTCLEKIRNQSGVERQLAEFQSLWRFSQTISIETRLELLYKAIHEQVETVMGELSSFAVALYDRDADLIHIPYMIEDGKAFSVDPFPIGEGLTSIVISTRRPLMLVEGAAERARQLGAVTVGAPAKSWLGVPMLAGGEMVGAIIAQDIHREHRFDENDQRLLSALASQAAVVVRNAKLVQRSQQFAENERITNEIVGKIRQSSDIQTILKTTADELGAALGVQRAYIKLEIDSEN